MNKQGQFLSVMRSPWILTTIPILLGGMWLINNTWVITNNLDKPYLLGAGPATIITGLAAWAAFAFFKTIVSWCNSTWKAFTEWKKKEGSSFWLVIYVFLGVSVLESGNFFNILLGPNSLLNSLGYASAFVIDLVAVECMRARLHAVRMRDRSGALLYLFGVIICASISAFANGYTALLHWHEPVHTPIPEFMIYIAPTIGVVFPLLMIFLSFAGDYTADQANTRLDPEEYKASELKRLKLLEIQRDILQSRMQIEQEIDEMTQRLKSGKSERTFFLTAWLFPKDPLNMQTVVTAVTEEVKKIYDVQLAGLNQQVSSQIRQWTEQRSTTSLQFQKEVQTTLSGSQTAHKILTTQQTATNEQVSKLAKYTQQSTEHLQSEIQTIHKSLTTHQSDTNNQISELAKYTQQSTRRFQDEIKSRLSTTVSNQIATALQSHNIPNETTIASQIATAIREYTVDQTDDHSVPIEGEKPLYPFMTPELKEVVIRFPTVGLWIRTGQRTVSIPDIVAATNFTPQFVGRQANDSMFTGIKTKDVYTTKSVINWLKTNPSPKRRSTKKQEQITEEIHVISQQELQETEEIPVATEKQNGHAKLPKETIKLDEYVELMGVM